MILAIDTSGSYCSVALRLPSGETLHRGSVGDGDHFEQLSTLVKNVLDQAGVDAESIEHVRVGAGPGSFTGIRIGMSFAKGLAWSLGVPLVAGSSFAACALAAYEATGETRSIGVVGDARRAEVFVALYERDRHTLRTLHEPSIIPQDKLRGRFNSVARWVSPERSFGIPGIEIRPESCVAAGLIALELLVPASGAELIGAVEPTYLREVAAKTIAERSSDSAIKVP